MSDTTKRKQKRQKEPELHVESITVDVESGPYQELRAMRNLLRRLRKRVNDLEQAARTHEHHQSGPVQRNGVHIDIRGQYWMHRPDGWHPMAIRSSTPAGAAGPEFPVQRLAEHEPPHS